MTVDSALTSQRAGRWRLEGGAAAVELVVIVPLLLTLILGTLAIGAAYQQKLGLTEGAREGARLGATLRTGHPNNIPRTGVPTDAWLLEVAQVATATAADWESVCVAYTGLVAFSPTSTQVTRSLRQTNGGGNSFGSTRCFDDGRPTDERRVQVSVRGTAPFDNFFFMRRTLELEGSSIARFERPYTAFDI
jgi:hypothetical protein